MKEPSDPETVRRKMCELLQVLCLDLSPYNGASVLAKAMDSTNIPDKRSHSNPRNSKLAVLGDAFLDLVVVETLYKHGYPRDRIEMEKQKLVNNKTQKNLLFNWGLERYFYNDDGFYSRDQLPNPVVSAVHIPYLEAVIGAVFECKGYAYAEKWVSGVVLPGLEKYAVEIKMERI